MHSLNYFLDGLKKQDIAVLGQAITLVESSKLEHQNLARDLIQAILPFTGKAKRIGISGPPGVGKSTFIEALGSFLTGQKLRVAVLAIDPSSQLTGGSILGDKTRMSALSSDPLAFIRPSPSGVQLGGVAQKTREAMLLCEAFAYDVIIVETVGVGQSEVAVSQMVDIFLLLMQPGSGDDLQGIKRGILELANLVIINKADGPLLTLAKLAQTELSQALHLLRQNEAFPPEVLLVSSLQKESVHHVWHSILNYYSQIGGKLAQLRESQLQSWLEHELTQLFKAMLQLPEHVQAFNQEMDDLRAGLKTVPLAAQDLFKQLVK